MVFTAGVSFYFQPEFYVFYSENFSCFTAEYSLDLLLEFHGIYCVIYVGFTLGISWDFSQNFSLFTAHFYSIYCGIFKIYKAEVLRYLQQYI
jgi:hypothetical protein